MKTLYNNFIRVMVAVATITFVVACNDDNGIESQLPQLCLEIEVDDITTNSAKIRVSHEQDTQSTWYGFVTDDVEYDEQTLIDATIREGVPTEELHRSKQYVTILEDLTPDTEYRYIAFGLTTDGVVYGDVVSVQFKTLADPEDNPVDTNGMIENEAWRVMYIGEDDINGVTYEHVVKVLSTDINSYAITLVYDDQYDVSQMRDLAEAMLLDMKEYLENFNAENGTAYEFKDMLYTGTNTDAFDLSPGTYRAIAVGYEPEGKVSGLYAVSDSFEVKEPVASSEYNAWLGEWSVEGQNGAVTNVTLTKGVANKTLYMTGWEGFENLPVEVEYNAELDAIFYYSQLVAEDYDLGDEYGKADIYFYAGDEDGYYYDNKEGDYYIAIGGILDDGVRAIVRYGVNVPDYPKFTQMFYMAAIGDALYAFSAEEEIPSFIAGMYPITKTQQLTCHYGFKPLLPNYKLIRIM